MATTTDGVALQATSPEEVDKLREGLTLEVDTGQGPISITRVTFKNVRMMQHG